MDKLCDVCGAAFDPSTRNSGKGRQRYCTASCRSAASNRRTWRRKHEAISAEELARLCVVCGVGFTTDSHHQQALTCSVACNEARQNRERKRKTAARWDVLPQRECAECKSLFKPHAFAINWAKYCSEECARKFRVRESSRKRTINDGNYNQRLKSKAWRVARAVVLERDHGECRICNGVHRRMSVHHIFGEHDHAPDNLITVCGKCHHELHAFALERKDGTVYISGKIFAYLGITSLEVAR